MYAWLFSSTYYNQAVSPLSDSWLVPKPLPDFISQPLRKIGRRSGIIATSQAGNGGLG